MSEIRKEPKVEEQKPTEDLREEGLKFEELLESFESVHSLEELHAIVDLSPELHALFGDDRGMSVEEIELAMKNLSPEDARAYVARTNAKKDLIPIVAKLTVLIEIISPEKYKELKEKYMRLSRAVGMINKGKIRHKD